VRKTVEYRHEADGMMGGGLGFHLRGLGRSSHGRGLEEDEEGSDAIGERMRVRGWGIGG
jgi:hypothetical protein